MSEKRDRFIRLANKRVNRALRELRLVGNLSNRGAYEYTEDDAKKITRAIQRELDLLKTRFGGTGTGADSEFSL